MQKLYAIVAVIQAILHYLAILGVILGIIAFIFGNSSRGWELVIGGVSLFVLKFVIGAVFILMSNILKKQSDK